MESSAIACRNADADAFAADMVCAPKGDILERFLISKVS